MATGTIQKDMVLLWTNPNPSAQFGAQTINIDLSKCKYILVEHHNDTLYFADILAVGRSTRINYLTYASGNAFAHQRPTTVSANGVTFDNANQNGSQNNSDIIPVRIYGIKA